MSGTCYFLRFFTTLLFCRVFRNALPAFVGFFVGVILFAADTDTGRAVERPIFIEISLRTPWRLVYTSSPPMYRQSADANSEENWRRFSFALLSWSGVRMPARILWMSCTWSRYKFWTVSRPESLAEDIGGGVY